MRATAHTLSPPLHPAVVMSFLCVSVCVVPSSAYESRGPAPHAHHERREGGDRRGDRDEAEKKIVRTQTERLSCCPLLTLPANTCAIAACCSLALYSCDYGWTVRPRRRRRCRGEADELSAPTFSLQLLVYEKELRWRDTNHKDNSSLHVLSECYFISF
jgi:hypothetical protein